MEQRAFDELWERLRAAEFTPAEEQEETCIYAQHFERWAAPFYQEEARRPSLLGINQKMLLLTKKYFEFRAAVPRSHRDRIGERSHVCIFHIFERYYQRFKVLELGLAPPMLFLPPPPPAPPPPPPTLMGITLGEIVGEEE